MKEERLNDNTEHGMTSCDLHSHTQCARPAMSDPKWITEPKYLSFP